jgi:hypothetical protein
MSEKESGQSPDEKGSGPSQGKKPSPVKEKEPGSSEEDVFEDFEKLELNDDVKPTGFDMDDLLKQLNMCVEEKPGQIDLHYYIDAYDELYKLVRLTMTRLRSSWTFFKFKSSLPGLIFNSSQVFLNFFLIQVKSS